jgi:hypothetical protein
MYAASMGGKTFVEEVIESRVCKGRLLLGTIGKSALGG